MFLAPSKSRYRAKIWIMVVSNTIVHIQIKITMPNPSQEPPASSKAPNQDLKDMDVLCTFKIKIDSQNLAYGCTKDQNQDLKDMDVLCTLKIKIESQSSEYGCTKHW